MMLDIKPERNVFYNCFEGIVASVAKYWDLEFIIMFLSVWSFKFESEECGNTKTLGARMSRGGKNNLLELLSDYHGLKIEAYYNIEENKILDNISNELLAERPIAIGVDAFLCPWNPAYKKYHIFHFFLVIGINEAKQELICIDPFCSSDIHYLPFDGFSSIVQSYLIFKADDSSRVDFNWRESLADTVIFIRDKDRAFEEMRKFASEIQGLENLSRESSADGDLYGALLLSHIKQLSSDRYKFRDLLQYISDRYQVKKIDPFVENMGHAAKMWDNILMKIAKEILRGAKGTGVNKIADMIYEVADYEENLALGLLEQCKNE